VVMASFIEAARQPQRENVQTYMHIASHIF